MAKEATEECFVNLAATTVGKNMSVKIALVSRKLIDAAV